MKSELWEIADKASILQVKKDRGLDVKEQYSRYMKEIEFLPKELFDNLYKINSAMFDMEEVISAAFELENFEMAGHLYWVLRGMTHLRTKAKHDVAKFCGEPLEVKKYGNGY